MNNNPEQEVFEYCEQHTRIGGTQESKKTFLHAKADPERVVVKVHEESVSAPLLCPVQSCLQSAIEYSSASSSEFSCAECCFGCESDYKWHDLEGKGFCVVLLLLLGYLIVGCVALPFLVLYLALLTLKAVCCDD